jgi:hypothetical protein
MTVCATMPYYKQPANSFCFWRKDVPHLLVDATLSFVSFAASAPHFGNMLIGAGIIPTLIELIKVTIPRRGGVSYLARPFSERHLTIS